MDKGILNYAKKSSARKTRTTSKKAQVKVELFLKWK